MKTGDYQLQNPNRCLSVTGLQAEARGDSGVEACMLCNGVLRFAMKVFGRRTMLSWLASEVLECALG